MKEERTDHEADDFYEGTADRELPLEEKPEPLLQPEDEKKDAEFDAELLELLEPDASGKKKNGAKKKRKKWSRKKKVIVTVAVLAVVCFMGMKVSGGKKEMPTYVTTVAVQKRDLTQDLAVNGPVSGTDSVDVVSNLHAEILELPVKEGDKVEKDQLLAALDPTDTEKERAVAQNAYDLAVSTYKEKSIEAENNYAKANEELKTARENYDRINALFQVGGASQVELQTAADTLNEANRQLRTFTIENGKAVANESYALQIQNAEFALEQREKELEDTQIKSPIAGTVVRVNTKVGRFADTTNDNKDPLFIIENLDRLEMKINISEYSIGDVKLGQKAVISADILNDETVNGQVTAISPTGEEKGGGSTERVIPITIEILDKETKLIAGITAKASIIIAEAKDAWVVPISSVLQKEDGINYIAAYENGTIKLVPVETGVETDIEIEVKPTEEGTITEGMEIVMSPDASLTDGMKVVLMPTGK